MTAAPAAAIGTLNKVRRGAFATLGDSTAIALVDIDGDATALQPQNPYGESLLQL